MEGLGSGVAMYRDRPVMYWTLWRSTPMRRSLRNKDLELGFLGLGAGGEDVEDEFGAVDDFDAVAAEGAEFFVDEGFEAADLGGGEVVVEDDDVGGFFAGEEGDFLGLAGADVEAGVEAVAVLDDFGDDFGAGGFGEGVELAEGVAGVGGGLGEEDADEDGAFLFDGEVGACGFGQGAVPP